MGAVGDTRMEAARTQVAAGRGTPMAADRISARGDLVAAEADTSSAAAIVAAVDSEEVDRRAARRWRDRVEGDHLEAGYGGGAYGGGPSRTSGGYSSGANGGGIYGRAGNGYRGGYGPGGAGYGNGGYAGNARSDLRERWVQRRLRRKHWSVATGRGVRRRQHWFATERRLWKLLRELGLRARLLWFSAESRKSRHDAVARIEPSRELWSVANRRLRSQHCERRIRFESASECAAQRL